MAIQETAVENGSVQWRELKQRFLRELSPPEQFFFLKKAQECVQERGYRVSEDLFHYCFFLTVNERLRSIGSGGGEGMLRVMLVLSRKDMTDEIAVLERRLEQTKLAAPDRRLAGLLEYLAS